MVNNEDIKFLTKNILCEYWNSIELASSIRALEISIKNQIDENIHNCIASDKIGFSPFLLKIITIHFIIIAIESKNKTHPNWYFINSEGELNIKKKEPKKNYKKSYNTVFCIISIF